MLIAIYNDTLWETQLNHKNILMQTVYKTEKVEFTENMNSSFHREV